VGQEAFCNTGGSSRVKLKSIQEMTLVDFDPQPLRGRIVRRAWLHLKRAGNERLHRVTVSSITADWVEGTASSYAPQEGSSCFLWRRYPRVPWAYPGSDLTAVVLSQGGSIWRMADASDPDSEGWQRIPVDPKVIAARVAGISYGFFVFDDTGSEWTRDGEKFEYRLFPNRFFFSKDSRRDDAPYFIVELGPRDDQPPLPPVDFEVSERDLPAGQARIRWQTPEDRGGGEVVGFRVTLQGDPVPQYLVPNAGKAGSTVEMHLRDLDLVAAEVKTLEVAAVDTAGNVGSPGRCEIRTSARKPLVIPAWSTIGSSAGSTIAPPFSTDSSRAGSRANPSLPQLGSAIIAVVDELDKVEVTTGRFVPEQPDEYQFSNHLWNAAQRSIRLFGARNEFVAFQILFRGSVRGLRPTLVFEKRVAGIRAQFAQLVPVPTKAGLFPDVALPLSGPIDLPIAPVVDLTPAGAGASRPVWSALLCELYIPHTVPSGQYRGDLTFRTGSESLRIEVSLRVWDFTLPDYLSFIPEMNCYGLPENERDYYRLAHLHRTVLNRLPYSQRGTLAPGCAPAWDGRQLNWADWDKRFGPYLDGSAFSDLPRKGVPLEVFYLPLHENWPTPIDDRHYNGSYWADQAFSQEYRKTFVAVSRQFAEHIDKQGWHDTLFQFYLNNKVDYKRSGWSRGSSPWLLDEPANFQDFWALRWFGEAFHEGINQVSGTRSRRAKLVFRCDISRPQWQRDALDHVLDYNVVNGGVFRQYHRLVTDRKERLGHIVVDYGSANPLDQSNVQPTAWCWDSWTLGSDGVIPWQTIGRDQSWLEEDELSLFYPGSRVGLREPVPSIRLKAFRRGQQDAEYLTILREVLSEPRWAVGEMVRQALNLQAVWEGTGFAGEDAGRGGYRALRPQDLWQARGRIAERIALAKPEPKRRLVDFRTPPRLPHDSPTAYAENAFSQ